MRWLDLVDTGGYRWVRLYVILWIHERSYEPRTAACTGGALNTKQLRSHVL